MPGLVTRPPLSGRGHPGLSPGSGLLSESTCQGWVCFQTVLDCGLPSAALYALSGSPARRPRYRSVLAQPGPGRGLRARLVRGVGLVSWVQAPFAAFRTPTDQVATTIMILDPTGLTERTVKEPYRLGRRECHQHARTHTS